MNREPGARSFVQSAPVGRQGWTNRPSTQRARAGAFGEYDVTKRGRRIRAAGLLGLGRGSDDLLSRIRQHASLGTVRQREERHLGWKLMRRHRSFIRGAHLWERA